MADAMQYLRQLNGIRWGASSVLVQVYATKHNIQRGEPKVIPVRLSPVPSPAVAGRGANRMPPTESGQSFTHGITDPNAAVAPRFHLGRLLRGQHGVGHEPIPAEHREVVASHPQSLAQEQR